jgi:ABC-type sugar transport system permease subunit
VSQQPPPGWVPPGYPGPGPYGSAPGYGWTAPVHQPGVVALRPLRLGDFFDGAFKTIRRNPAAMVGLAALVTTVFLVIPVVLTLVLASTGDLSRPLLSSSDPQVDLSSVDAGTALSVLGTLVGALATVVLNGMLVQVVAQAVLGRRTTPGQAWAATRGRLLRLVGLTALSSLVAVLLIGVPVAAGVLAGVGGGVGVGLLVGVPLFLAGLVALAFVTVRYFLLAAPALVLERIGVLASVRRAGQLSRQQFWRLFGVTLLTTLVVGVVGQVVAIPLGLLGVAGPLLLPGTGGALVLVFSSYLSQVVVGAVTTPFTSAVVALQYVDQRIRKEGLDVQLIAAAEQPPQQASQPGPR